MAQKIKPIQKPIFLERDPFTKIRPMAVPKLRTRKTIMGAPNILQCLADIS